jgi:hypothetical protein
MNEVAAANLALTLLNYAIARAQADPIAAGKIQSGQPLDSDDFERLGVNRESAKLQAEQAIESAE